MSNTYKKINYTTQGNYGSTEIGTLYMVSYGVADSVIIFDEKGNKILSFDEWGEKDMGQAIVELLSKDYNELEYLSKEEIAIVKNFKLC